MILNIYDVRDKKIINICSCEIIIVVVIIMITWVGFNACAPDLIDMVSLITVKMKNDVLF